MNSRERVERKEVAALAGIKCQTLATWGQIPLPDIAD